MKAVLISIKPQWCELIASGEKTVEANPLDAPFLTKEEAEQALAKMKDGE